MNTNNENMTEQQRLGQLKNLVMLASVDEKITDSELAVLLAVASRDNQACLLARHGGHDDG